MKKKKPVICRTRAEELEALRAQVEKIKKDPAYGLKLAIEAGIYDKNGELTPYYRRTE